MEHAKILVIEDEADLRDALQITLTRAGYTVDVATDGKAGLDAAEQNHPDLILLDIGLPIMNGHQVLAEIRKRPWGKDTHVVMLTNADDPTNITTGVGLKAEGYLIKSQIDLETVLKKVKQHLAGYY